MSHRRLNLREIEELRSQRAQGMEEAVLASSWGISRATVSRHTHGVTRVVRPDRTSQSLLARARALSPVDRLERGGRPRRLPVVTGGGPWEPACMDPDDLAAWKAGDIRACQDCTVEYSDQMRAIDRCNGVPGELLNGALPQEEDLMTEPRIVPNGTETAVAFELPCPSCIHERVCGIKRSLDAIDTLPVTVPRLDKALTVGLTAKVDCSEYSPVKKAKRQLSPAQLEAARKSAAAMRERMAAKRAGERAQASA